MILDSVCRSLLLWQNLASYRQYEYTKLQLSVGRSSPQPDVSVFHGTSTGVHGIVHNGFQTSFGVCRAGSLWFAQNSSYSSAYGSPLFLVSICPLAGEFFSSWCHGHPIYIVGNQRRMLATHLISFSVTHAAAH